MLPRCIFCHSPFAEGVFHHLPVGRTIAYDPERGRLWVVCDRCHRWTLWPIEDRDGALHELERRARDVGKMVARTENISLLEAEGVLLVRVGRAGLAEQAWWRYGRELVRRKSAFESTGARLAAYTFGALAWASEAVGLADPDVNISWDDQPMTDILRWRRFGWAAWHGRASCPYCRSTLRALRYDLSWWVYPLRGPDGHVEVGVPCPRCDPWTPENVYHLKGEIAEHVLRRCLAYQNIAGASESVIRAAAGAIEHSGSPGAFALDLTGKRQSLWKMGRTKAVALEIALGESVEKRLLDLEVRGLEHVWRREEEIARISDEELTPQRLLEAHLRRLPIRIGSRRALAAADVEPPPE